VHVQPNLIDRPVVAGDGLLYRYRRDDGVPGTEHQSGQSQADHGGEDAATGKASSQRRFTPWSRPTRERLHQKVRTAAMGGRDVALRGSTARVLDTGLRASGAMRALNAAAASTGPR